MPPGGLLLGDLVKQQDFRGSGGLFCNASWFSWRYLGFSGSGGYGVNPGSVSDYINTALAGHRLDIWSIKTSHQSQISATQTLRTTITTQISLSWPQSLNHLGSILARHLEPRPFQTFSEGNRTFWNITLEGLKIIISTLRSLCERYSSHSTCWVMLPRLICLIFPVL